MNDSPEVSTLPIRKFFQTPPEQRAQWVERFCESGLSLREFSAQHGLGYMSLWRWVRAQRDETSDQAGPAVPAFAEIKLAPSVERAEWVAELSLPSGKVLRLAKEVPACMLEQLLRLC